MGRFDDLTDAAVAGAPLPAAPAPGASGARFDDLTDAAVRQQRNGGAALAVSLESQANPDKAAEALALARRYNMPAAVTEQFVEDYKARAKAEDARKVFDVAPKLGAWVAENPDRAKVAHDDLDNLGGIEQSITAIGRASRALLAGAGPGLGAAAYGAAAYPFEAIGATGIGGKLRDLQRDSQGVAQRFIGENADAGIVERGIVSGMQSAGQTLATLPLGFANAARVSGEALMLGAMGALTFGQSYGKARDKGVGVGMSGFLGAADATAEVVTEKFFGAAGLLKDAKAGMGAARLFIRDIAREIPGEVGATLWQNFNEWAIVNPERTIGEFIEDQPAAIGETIIATIVGGGAQVGAIRGVQRLIGDADRRQSLAQEAEAGAQQAEALAQFAAASKVMGRDAETVREFVAQVADEQGDAPTEFFVDAEQLVNVLNQSGMTAQEFEALAPVAAGQMNEPGGLVRLPMSEFVGMGEAAASLIDHIRTAEDMPSLAEAREFFESDQGAALKGEVDRELSALTERDAYQDDVEKAAAGFRAGLDAAARFTPEANKFLAALPANYYAATAKRLGITVEEFLDRYQLRSTSKAVKAKPGDAAMSQGLVVIRDGYQNIQIDGADVEVISKDGSATINMVRTPEDQRGKGLARAALSQVVQAADAQGLTLSLTPEPMDKKTSKAKLEAFYKSVGFVSNIGRKRDFRYSGTMIRRPKAGATLNQSTQRDMIELRKREAVLTRLLECL